MDGYLEDRVGCTTSDEDRCAEWWRRWQGNGRARIGRRRRRESKVFKSRSPKFDMRWRWPVLWICSLAREREMEAPAMLSAYDGRTP